MSAASESLSLCLVEYSPLAARHLEKLLAPHHFQLYSYREVLEGKRRFKLPISVFLLDRGTLPMPLSKYLRYLRVRFPDARILVLDDPQPSSELSRLLFLGIQGFLTYDDAEDQLVPAVRTVADGNLWVAPDVVAQYVGYSSQLSNPRAERAEELTKRERRIIELVQRRLSNKEISSILGVSESTVKFHLSNIFAKLGVSDRHAVLDAVARSPHSLLPQKSK